MRKVLIFITLALFVASPCLSARSVRKAAVQSVITQYKGQDGVEVVSIGPLMMKVLVSAAKNEAKTQEDREAVDLLREIRKMLAMNYNEASEDLRAQISRDLASALRNADKLMEAKGDNGEMMQVYGSTDRDGQILKDVVLFAPESATILCIFGTFAIDQLGRLIEVAE